MQIQGIIGAIPHSEYKHGRAGWKPRRPEDRRPTMKEYAVCLSICSAGSALRSPAGPQLQRLSSADGCGRIIVRSRRIQHHLCSQHSQHRRRIHAGCHHRPHPRHPAVGHEPTDRLPHRIRAVDPQSASPAAPRQRGGDGWAQKLGSMIQLKVSNTAKNRTLTAE